MRKIHLSDQNKTKVFEGEVEFIIPPDVIVREGKVYQYKVTGKSLDESVIVDYFRECNALHIGM